VEISIGFEDVNLMFVSIIIPMLNEEKFVARCLEEDNLANMSKIAMA
jgi:hypothetical protein